MPLRCIEQVEFKLVSILGIHPSTRWWGCGKALDKSTLREQTRFAQQPDLSFLSVTFLAFAPT